MTTVYNISPILQGAGEEGGRGKTAERARESQTAIQTGPRTHKVIHKRTLRQGKQVRNGYRKFCDFLEFFLRTLMESYHRVSEERDRGVAGEREVARRHDHLLQEWVYSNTCIYSVRQMCVYVCVCVCVCRHQRLQARMETRISEIQATLQVLT